MPESIGWTESLPELLAAAESARAVAAPFDEAARKRVIHRKVAEAGKFTYWPAILGVLALALPNGWIGLIIGLVVFGIGAFQAVRHREAVADSLARETAQLRGAHQVAAMQLDDILSKANRGEVDALRSLLARWRERCPESVQSLTLDVSTYSDSFRLVGGRGVDRSILPTFHRRNDGGRKFIEKRKAVGLDEDLAELNSGAALSALFAMFGGASAQQVAVRLTIENSDGDRIPWVTLSASLDGRRLTDTLASMESPVAAIRQLGGDVGRCRSQRYTPAKEPALTDAPPDSLAARRGDEPKLLKDKQAATGALQAQGASAAVSFPDRPAPARKDVMGARAARVTFGDATRVTSATQIVPPAPPTLQHAVTFTISVSGLGDEFASVAKKHANVVGDPHAQFVPFQAYWSTYKDMNPAQLKFYFRWRTAIRNGEAIPTDLSYIFVHVYELLHVVGAKNGQDAAEQLARLWRAYRPTYPKLDTYLITWIADLYATEVSPQAALTFVEGCIDANSPPSDEVLLTTDPRWATGDYDGIALPGLAMLLAERRLGNNKFVREHNAVVEGHPWVEGAYRAAMKVADEIHQVSKGISLREATVKATGLRVVSRSAFVGAVYSWNRKDVKLGRVPTIKETSPTVTLYRGVTRHAENLLRKERGFSGRLRGIDLTPDVMKVLEERIAAYIRATKPRTRVTIDLERAQAISLESADTRARLLQGVEADHDLVLNATFPSVPRAASGPSAQPDEPQTDGLLTDLAAVEFVMDMLSRPAKALLTALANSGWEVPEDAPDLASAVDGVLIAPLVEMINARSNEVLVTDLVVREGNVLVVQEDYRDEVYWIVNGHLDGFARSGVPAIASVSVDESFAGLTGFGPVEFRALMLIAAGGDDTFDELSALAEAHHSTVLILVDQLNACGLTSPHGDILVDADATPPTILPDAYEFVGTLLARVARPTSVEPGGSS